jgi:biotin operon repressor
MALPIDDALEDVLEVFLATDGYATTGYLVDKTGLTRPTINKRLDRLRVADCIEYVHEPTAFWQLKNDPREE